MVCSTRIELREMLDFIPKSIQRKGAGVLAIVFNTIVVKIDAWMDGRTDGRKEVR